MEAGKRCLIVVDYQKDFVDGSLGFEKAVTLDHGIAEKIRLYHSRGDDVMFTLDTRWRRCCTPRRARWRDMWTISRCSPSCR